MSSWHLHAQLQFLIRNFPHKFREGMSWWRRHLQRHQCLSRTVDRNVFFDQIRNRRVDIEIEIALATEIEIEIDIKLGIAIESFDDQMFSKQNSCLPHVRLIGILTPS